MSRDNRANTREKADRSSRTPLGRGRQKLSVPEISGFVLRWINDNGGRLLQAEEGGYAFVTKAEIGHVGESVEDGNTDIGNRVSKVVGKTESGSPMRAYLMKIKKEWYQEDQVEKQTQIDQVERAIREGSFEAKPDHKRYIPKEGIHIS